MVITRLERLVQKVQSLLKNFIMCENGVSTEFIDLVTNPDHKHKPEIFKISVIKEYIHYWSEKDHPEECTVCQFAIQNQKQDKQLCIKKLLLDSSQFAQRMPENMIGVIFTWLFIRYKGLGIIDVKHSFILDPMSILFHFVVGCCDSVVGTDTQYFDICKVFKSSLFSETGILSSIAVPSKPTKRRKKVDCSEEIKLLIQCLRGYVDAQVLQRKMKQNYCGNCTYANDGEISVLPDYRIYVSQNWVMDTLRVDYDYFIENEIYETLLPGIYFYKEEQKQKNSLNEVTTDDKVRGSMGIRASRNTDLYHNLSQSNNQGIGFVAIETLFDKSIKNTHKYTKEHCLKAKSLSSRISYILKMIKTIPKHFENKRSPLHVISQNFPICKWCALCVDKHMRLLINDLFVMCEKKSDDIGIRKGNFAIQIAPLPVFSRPINKNDTYLSQKTEYKSTLGFYKSALPFHVLKSVFSEWSQQKYPFLHSSLDVANDMQEICSLYQHQNGNKSIYCSGNIRRMYIESDGHKMNSRSRCFIVHAIKILQILLDSNMKLSKEIALIKKVAFDHKISFSPTT